MEKHFKSNPGGVEDFHFPITHAEAKKVLKAFLTEKLTQFGPYEDAIAADEPFLFHSTLSAPLNSGLITPREVVEETLKYAKAQQSADPISRRIS